MSFSRSINPPLHYIWIGPSPKETGGEPGHDVIGPIKMATANQTNPLFFWCLAAHETFYKKRFEKFSNLQVCTIEEGLADHIGNKEIILIINNVIEEHLKPERSTVRDKVSVKNIFSLFLLYSKGGYVLDTNIIPSTSNAFSLPYFDEFYFPKMNAEKSVQEFWLMYSPKAKPITFTLLNEYLIDWNVSQKIFVIQQYSQPYFSSLSNIIPDLLYNHLEKKSVKYWLFHYTNKTESQSSCIIPALNIKKYYYNTHKYDYRAEHDRDSLYTQKFFSMTGCFFQPNITRIIASYVPDILEPKQNKGMMYTQIYFDIYNNNLEGIQFQIDEGVDVNQHITASAMKGETPLHAAIKLNRPEAVKLLLENKADPNLTVSYRYLTPMNAYDLVDFFKNNCFIPRDITKKI